MEIDAREPATSITKVRFADDAYIDISTILSGEIRMVNQNNDEEGFSIVVHEIDNIIKALNKIKDIKSYL